MTEELTEAEKRMHAIGQMHGLQRADAVDGGNRWDESLVEMALLVAIRRLGIDSLEFSIEEWLEAAADSHGFAKQEVTWGQFRLEAVTREQMIARRQAEMAAMMGHGAEA